MEFSLVFFLVKVMSATLENIAVINTMNLQSYVRLHNRPSCHLQYTLFVV
jgi:hypothetical protein